MNARIKLILLVLVIGSDLVCSQQINVVNPSAARINQTFTVNITTSDCSLAGIEFTLLFNTSILQAQDIQIGSHLTGSGTVLTIPSDLIKAIDNNQGKITLASALTDDSTAQGNGTITELTFKAVGTGNSYLDLENVTLVDDNIQEINGVEIKEGNVTVREYYIDLAISEQDITYSLAEPVEGMNVSINITAHNIGELDLNNVSIEFSVDNVSQENRTISLPANESKLNEFIWTAVGGNHTLSFRLDPRDDVDEINEANNYASVDLSVAVDSTPPAIIVNDISNGTWYKNDRTLTFTVTDDYDPDPIVTSNYPNGTLFSDEDFYQVSINASDWAGNKACKKIYFVIDKTAPEITVEGVADDEIYDHPVTLTYSAIDNLDPEPEVASNYLNGTVFSEDGNYTVNITALDKAGNTAQKVMNFEIIEGEAHNRLICVNLTNAVNYVTGGYAPDCPNINPGGKKLKLVDSSCNPLENARINLRKENNAYITYENTDEYGVADFSSYNGSSLPSKFEVDYHGAKYLTEAGSYGTGTGVQTREYSLKFIGSDCEPIQDARVNLRKENDGYVTYRKTDGNGTVSFEVVPEARMKLEVDYSGGKWVSNANKADIDVVLGAEGFRLRLIDSNSNPIQDARVNLRKENDGYVTYAKTNASGLASFEVVPNATMKLEVDYHGATYRTTPSTTHEPETIQTKEFSLHLTDSNNNPVENARINLRKENNGYVTYAKTNPSGLASFEVVPNASMKHEVDYHGATYKTDTVVVSEDTQLTVQTYQLSLHLTDSDGDPIQDARVNLRKENDGYVTYAKTNASGLASFEVVPNASMKLEADYHGATYKTDIIVVSEDRELQVQTRSFSLLLTDSNSNPIENAQINLRKENNGYVTYAKTDDNGIAAFEVVPNASMKLEVDYHGATYNTDTTIVSEDTELIVQTYHFSTHLTDSDGNPIQDAWVNLRKENNGYVTYNKTNASGLAGFEVVPNATMKLEADYHGATYKTAATLVSNNTHIAVQTKAFSLYLIDSESNPVEDARVNLRKSNDGYVTYAKTNASGLADFEVVPNASMKLEADYHGATYKTDTVVVSENTQLQVQTQPLTAHITVNGTDLPDQRIDLLKSSDGYVTHKKTGADGRATFQTLPLAQHKLRSTYNGDTWTSNITTGPAEITHNFS